MAEWSEIDVTKVGAVMAGIGKMVPEMNLQEVDETFCNLNDLFIHVQLVPVFF